MTFTNAMEPHIKSIRDGEYDLPLRESPASVLDIGANEGGFSVWARSKWPDALIRTYEPNPSSFALLTANLFGDKNVAFENRAITGDGRNIVLKVGEFNSGEASIFGPDTRSPIQCDSVAASEIPSCEFVKIDTEGCEREIIEKLNLSGTKTVVLEYHRASDFQPILDIMDQRKFHLFDHRAIAEGRGILKFTRESTNSPSSLSKVFIGWPIYGQVDPNFFKSALKLVVEFSTNTSILPWIGDSLIPRARNSITSRFLESDCTHLLMIDSDLIFGVEQVQRILSHGKDIVSGFYPKKQEGKCQMVCNSLDIPGQENGDGLIQIKYAGTGFLCVSRRVFEAMIEKHRDEIEFHPDQQESRTEWDFWSVGVYKYPDGKRRYLSEDWYFCQRAIDLGFQVWGDTHILLKHSGAAIYPLSYQQKQLLGNGHAATGSDAVAVPSASEQPLST